MLPAQSRTGALLFLSLYRGGPWGSERLSALTCGAGEGQSEFTADLSTPEPGLSINYDTLPLLVLKGGRHWDTVPSNQNQKESY